jgi:hypothetical protein
MNVLARTSSNLQNSTSQSVFEKLIKMPEEKNVPQIEDPDQQEFWEWFQMLIRS